MNKEDLDGYRMYELLSYRIKKYRKYPNEEIDKERVKIYLKMREKYKKNNSMYLKEYRRKNERNN